MSFFVFQILKLERSISYTFQDYDQMERELFTAFTNAIRDSHEKQRAQAEYTKYFGLVLSIAGSFLAFVYTTVKKQDIKLFIEEQLSSLETKRHPEVLNLIQNNETLLEEVRQNRVVLNQVVSVIGADKIHNEPNDDSVQVIDVHRIVPAIRELNVVYKVIGGLVIFSALMSLLSSS